MKNITLSVPDDVYRAARVRAAEHGTSVSALVRRYLQSLSEYGAAFERLEARQREVQAQIEQFRASDRMSREEVHERAVR